MTAASSLEGTVRRLLLVEDSAVWATVVRSAFADTGTVITHVETLGDAQQLVVNDPGSVDCVLLDLVLPDSMGIETVERFRDINDLLPVIVFTATDDERIGVKAMALGAQDYLTKDITFPKLLKRAVTYAIMRNREERVLREAKVNAEEATRLKDMFVSLVAHDVQAPISTMISSAELLMMKGASNTPADIEKFAGYIHSSGHELLKVVRNILDLGRIQSGVVTPRSGFFDARYLVDSVVQRIGLIAETKGVAIDNRVSGNTRLYGDRVLMAQVIQNLLFNAVKFSHSGGRIEITVPEDGALAVSDQGVGIPPASLERLFQPGEKVRTPGTAGETGTGFGLAICHGILAAHGGELTARSARDEGSTFTIRLPRVRPRVLVVDDSSVHRKIVSALLEKLGCEVDEAAHGREALARMASDAPPPHLVISDLFMEEMDGFTFLEEVRELPAAREIPVIVITGDEKLETRERVLALGAHDYTTKPITLHDFIPRVRRFVG